MTTEFLSGRNMLEKVKYVMGGDKKRCGVAFWSKQFVKQSGINFSKTKILLDVSFGATSVEAIRALDKQGAKIRHQYGYHGKFFLSDLGAVIGSANAGIRALGSEDVDPKHFEAGAFVPPSSKAYADLTAYFKDAFEKAHSKDEAEVLADKLYRPNRSARVGDNFDPNSIFDRVIADPEAFRGIGFVLTKDAEEKTQKKLNEDNGEKYLGHELDLDSLDMFSEWGSEDVDKWPDVFLSIYCPKRKVEWSARRVQLKNRDTGRVWASNDWRDIFDGRVGPTFTKNRIPTTDDDRARAIIASSEFGQLYRTAKEFREALLKAST